MIGYYLQKLILWFNYTVVVYYTIANAIYLLLLLLAVWLIMVYLLRLSYGRYQEHVHPSVVLPVSVLISAYNEASNIVDSIRALFLLNYPNYEIVVINDGSSDDTLQKLIKCFNLRKSNIIYRPVIPTASVKGFYINPQLPKLLVIDKEHSGKADSLNTGINVARSPYFCSVDADSILEKDALVRLMRPIMENPERVRATGGIVRIVNGSIVKDGKLMEVRLPKDSLSRLQVVEYIRSFLFGRAGLSVLNSLLVISGTFSLFHKRSVQVVGGYNTNTVTEDMELVIRLHKHFIESSQRYRISFVPDPICWTEAPKDFTMLRKQRRRWHTGLADSMLRYRRMLFNPYYKRIGLFAFPYQFVVELLGPVIEVAGYFIVILSFILGIIDAKFFMLFFTMAILVGVFFSTGAILLEEITYRRYPRLRELLTLLLYGVLENFGYRQLNAWWRTEALLRYLLPRKKTWEYVKKDGFEPPAVTGAEGETKRR